MTMQIGMVGKDGIVLASDTKYTQSPLSTDAKRYGFANSKIGISDDRRIAASRAMNMRYAARAACLIIDGLAGDVHLQGAYSDYSQKIEKIGTEAAGESDIQCIVGFADPEPSMYRLTSSTKWLDIPCHKVTDKIPAGDIINAAVFWSERYYVRLPVSRLLGLAAQLIVSAAELNNGGIGGLEIVYCDAYSSGFRRLSPSRNDELEAEARERGESIRQSILCESGLP